MATTAPKRKVKHAGSRPNHPAASKQRIFAAATPPPLTRAERLKVVDPTGPKPTPPDALLRLEAVERRLAALTAGYESAVARLGQIEAQLAAEAQADEAEVSLLRSAADGHAAFVAGQAEAAAKLAVDAGAEDLGGESA